MIKLKHLIFSTILFHAFLLPSQETVFQPSLPETAITNVSETNIRIREQVTTVTQIREIHTTTFITQKTVVPPVNLAWKSVLYPGYGQTSMGYKVRGYSLTGLFTAGITSSFILAIAGEAQFNKHTRLWTEASTEANASIRLDLISESYTAWDQYLKLAHTAQGLLIGSMLLYTYNIIDAFQLTRPNPKFHSSIAHQGGSWHIAVSSSF